MFRCLVTVSLLIAATGTWACADAPVAPTPPAPSSAAPVTRFLEVTLADTDPTIRLAPVPSYMDETAPDCGPCASIPLGPGVRSIVLNWTADLQLHTWIEATAANGGRGVIQQNIVGVAYASVRGRSLQIVRSAIWDRVTDLQLKVGVPVKEPRTLLGAPVSIGVTITE